MAAGHARGPAFVARDPAAGLAMPAGAVLVAPSTDPAWTPLFLRASALVMEAGGYLSHGAIVAREFGIPRWPACPASSMPWPMAICWTWMPARPGQPGGGDREA